MAIIEVGDDLLGFLKNIGAFERGFCDGGLAMRTTGVKGETNLISIIIPVKSILHFITIIIVVSISDNRWWGNINLVFTKNFCD